MRTKRDHSTSADNTIWETYA